MEAATNLKNLLFGKDGFTENTLAASAVNSKNKITWKVPVPKKQVSMNSDTKIELTLVN